MGWGQALDNRRSRRANASSQRGRSQWPYFPPGIAERNGIVTVSVDEDHEIIGSLGTEGCERTPASGGSTVGTVPLRRW